jgi:hypothetical protein
MDISLGRRNRGFLNHQSLGVSTVQDFVWLIIMHGDREESNKTLVDSKKESDNCKLVRFQRVFINLSFVKKNAFRKVRVITKI